MDTTNQISYQINHSSPLPRYHQIKNHLRDLMENDQLRPGEVLPSEKDLASNYGVNRLTLRHALTELVSEGLLVRRHGVGTFVAEPKITQSHARLLSFTQRMAQLGRVAKGEILEAERMPVPAGLARQLNIKTGDPVLKIGRLRLADSQPVMIETAYIPEAICPDLLSTDLTQSIYNIMSNEFGVVPKTADQFLEPVLLTEWEADLLEAKAGSPALLVETSVRDGNGTIIEFSKAVLRGDISRLYFHTTNAEAPPTIPK
jgi:GntR family transcriptional regulator